MKDYLNNLSKEVIINFHTVRLADEIKRLVHNFPL